MDGWMGGWVADLITHHFTQQHRNHTAQARGHPLTLSASLVLCRRLQLSPTDMRPSTSGALRREEEENV